MRICPFLFLLLAACQNPPRNIDPATLENAQVSGLMEQAAGVRQGGDSKAAEALYAQAIEQTKTSVEPHLALARLKEDEKDPDAAIAVLKEATARKADEPRVNGELGKLYIAQNEGQSALDAFQHGLNAVPENLDLLNGKGVALDLLGKHAEAQAVYLAAIAKKQGNEDFIESNLALSYLMSNKPDEAIARLKALPNLAASPVMRQNLALAYGVKGDIAQARQWGGKDVNAAEMESNIDFYQRYREKLKVEVPSAAAIAIEQALTPPPEPAVVEDKVPFAAEERAVEPPRKSIAIAAPVDTVESAPIPPIEAKTTETPK